ncbi:gag-protease polyprotein [Cucumis melo var. makuwa]|uniref:Gag-protease polyprotein n=1 Tax=Cucumis melo var. makuwa TaxID=1194695 RepID=A0A5A7SMY9_CUCMM|nr:gag-protease polyprotein [Cucumis melo var. makuwa]TYK09631.1 gag-protease polyprotein [Cucumis melo var. makuwa]
MSPRRGARRGGGRGGRGAGRTQSEEQPVVQAALAPFLAAQQTQAASVQGQTVPSPAPVGAQPAPTTRRCSVQFSSWRIEAPPGGRLLRANVNKITWEQFKENFYAKFFSANVKHTKQQEFLNLEQGNMTVEQYDAKFDMLSHFAPDVVRDEASRTEKFVRGLSPDFQAIVQALWPATHADALRIALDLSLHERADPSKAAGRGSSLGQKMKVETQPALAPQRDLRCGRVHGGRRLVGSGVCFRCKQPGHNADVFP